MSTNKKFTWRDPRRLSVVVLVILAIDILWQGAGLVVWLNWGAATDTADIAPDDWTGPQMAATAFQIFGLVSILMGIPILFWILRVARNAYVLAGQPLENSPIFTALWWYVIPIMSLFKPVQALGEVWDASAIDGERRSRLQFLLLVWWVALLASGLFTRFAGWVGIHHFTSSPAAIASIVQSMAFAGIVLRITAMQVEHHVDQAATFA